MCGASSRSPLDAPQPDHAWAASLAKVGSHERRYTHLKTAVREAAAYVSTAASVIARPLSNDGEAFAQFVFANRQRRVLLEDSYDTRTLQELLAIRTC